MANFILAISNGIIVVLWKLLKTRPTGNSFAKFIKKSFSEAFSIILLLLLLLLLLLISFTLPII